MSAIDYTREETLDLSLFSPSNPLAGGIEGVDPILAAIEEHAGGLMPNEVAEKPFSRGAVHRFLAKHKRDIKIILDLLRTRDPEVYYSLSFVQSNVPVPFWLWMVAPMTYFQEPAGVEERSMNLVSLARGLANASRPAYGYCHSKGDLALGSDPHPDDPFAPNEIYEVYWLNIYGPEMVERIGRQRILATPAALVEELAYGGVLLLTTPTPAGITSEEGRLAQARALAHLRDNVTLEEALERLRRRSAILQPVGRDWDPDIADVLEPILDHVDFTERQQETARLNAYRPPAVTEWLPASEIRPSDVADPAETIAQYDNLYAEQLVALLFREVPEVRRASPESLPRIDYYFWRSDYPGQFDRADIDNDLVPAIGAYLGKVMALHLGGRWVPRRNPDESQLVIGDRAWLPFLRARHYMRSRQSVLDYSLTQLYRVAARAALATGGI